MTLKQHVHGQLRYFKRIIIIDMCTSFVVKMMETEDDVKEQKSLVGEAVYKVG